MGSFSSSELGALVATGRTSDVYEFGSGSVVKVPRPGTPPHWAQLEATYAAAVQRLGVLAPSVREVISIDGRDAIVFERIEGFSMWHRLRDDPSRAGAVGRELAEIHLRIHACGLPTGVPLLTERMAGKIGEATRLPADDRREAQELLAAMPQGAALLHGDLHPANILMSDRGPVVIDWFDAAVGHPAADVVRTALLLRPMSIAERSAQLPDIEPGVLATMMQGYLGEFSTLIPIELAQRWEPLVAASRLAEGIESDEEELVRLWELRDR